MQGDTALLAACGRGNAATVALLLRRGALVDVPNVRADKTLTAPNPTPSYTHAPI